MRRSRANVNSRCPTRSILQGSFSGSIRQYFTISVVDTYYKSFTVSDFLADAYASLKSQFAECRVHAVRVYYQPDASTAITGQYAACLVDSTTVAAKTLTYGQILSMPGSTARKMWQSTGLHWKWTEPSDAEFVATNDTTTKVCLLFMATNATLVKLGGDLIVDVSMTLRTSGSLLGHPVTRLLTENSWPLEVLESARDTIDERMQHMLECPSSFESLPT